MKTHHYPGHISRSVHYSNVNQGKHQPGRYANKNTSQSEKTNQLMLQIQKQNERKNLVQERLQRKLEQRDTINLVQGRIPTENIYQFNLYLIVALASGNS